MKYRKRILLSILCIVLIPLLTTLIVLFILSSDQYKEQQLLSVTNTSQYLQKTTDYFIAQIYAELTYITTIPELRTLQDWYEESDFREKRSFFEKFDPFKSITGLYNLAYFVHPRDELAMDIRRRLIHSIDLSPEQAIIQKIMSTLESYYGVNNIILPMSNGDSSSSVYLIRSIKNAENNSEFYVFISLDGRFFKNIINEIFLTDSSFVIITDKENRPLVIHQMDDKPQEIMPSWTGLAAADQRINLSDGSEILYSLQVSPDTGFQYLYGINYRNARQELSAFLLLSGGISAVILIVFISLGIFLSQNLYRPIHNLLQSLNTTALDFESDEFGNIKNYISQLEFENRQLNTSQNNDLLYKERLLQNLLYNSYAPDSSPDEIQKTFDASDLSISLCNDCYFLVIMCLFKNTESTTTLFNRNFQVVRKDAGMSGMFSFDKTVSYEIVLIESSTLVFICQIPEHHIDTDSQNNSFNLSGFFNTHNLTTNQCSISYSTIHKGMFNLHHAFTEARVTLERRNLFHDQIVISYQQILAQKDRIHHYPFEEERRIITALKKREQREAVEELSRFFSIMQTSGMSYRQIKYAAFHLFDSLIGIIRDFELPLEESMLSKITLTWQEVEDTNHPHEIPPLIRNVLQLLFTILESKHYTSSLMIAESVKNFIDKRYIDRNLSLDLVADELKYSISHISSIFKITYGETIKQYITNLRLSKARELLISTNNKIESIGRNTGYDKVSSFIKIFKTYMGETPKEFRLRNRANS